MILFKFIYYSSRRTFDVPFFVGGHQKIGHLIYFRSDRVRYPVVEFLREKLEVLIHL